MAINFIPFQVGHLSLWQKWIDLPHVKTVWFMPGYESADYIYEKIQGNGYDYPFIIAINAQSIGYIMCSDLYAYSKLCPQPKGIFTQESQGSFSMDLFIGEENYLNKGWGTKIVKAFIGYIFQHFSAKVIFIDPATTNQRAIRCYEKAGFKLVKQAFDGITTCAVMAITQHSET